MSSDNLQKFNLTITSAGPMNRRALVFLLEVTTAQIRPYAKGEWNAIINESCVAILPSGYAAKSLCQ
ncbi:MAG: hypothetical protein BroJett011_19340 [Chloroflexota bacterium]|nr:MAG: hypothetical protein BroJett011_19340 [Chloroflexota bacterium]